MRCGLFSLLTLVFLLGWAPPARADDPPADELVERVKKAIDLGVDYLRRQQNNAGDWENIEPNSRQYPGGWTSLALLALLNSGVPPEDPIIQRGLKSLRTIESNRTYVVGLQTMVFAQAGQAVDKERIQRNVDWLIAARSMNGGKLQGWGYGQRDGPDNSNSQYALLGLHEGYLAGAEVKPEVWEGKSVPVSVKLTALPPLRSWRKSKPFSVDCIGGRVFKLDGP